MRVAGIILAGGASRRMGSPKPLLLIGKETFLDRLIRVLGAVCDPVIVVLGHQSAEILAGIKRSEEAMLVVNPEPDRGQLSSLQCGLRAVPADCGAVLFMPVDHPAVEASTVDALAHTIEYTGALLTIPRCRGRHGHPVCLRSEVVVEILALGPDGLTSDVIHAHRGNTLYVDVADAGTVNDVDDPDSYRGLTGLAETP